MKKSKKQNKVAGGSKSFPPWKYIHWNYVKMTETDFFIHFCSSFNHYHSLWRWELFEIIVFKFNERTVRFKKILLLIFQSVTRFVSLGFIFHPCFHLSSFFDTLVKHCLTLLIPWYITRKMIIKDSSFSTTVTCFFLTCFIHFLLSTLSLTICRLLKIFGWWKTPEPVIIVQWS